jgi:hypothetical protein
MTHENSKRALKEERPNLSKRCQMILDVMNESPIAMTDRGILMALNEKFETNLPDMNCVRPRINELIKSSHLVETGSTRCGITNKKVRTVYLSDPNEKQMNMFSDFICGDPDEFVKQSAKTLHHMGKGVA